MLYVLSLRYILGHWAYIEIFFVCYRAFPSGDFGNFASGLRKDKFPLRQNIHTEEASIYHLLVALDT